MNPIPPNNPRAWAELAIRANPRKSIEVIPAIAIEMFLFHRLNEILAPRHERLESLLVMLRPGCAETATIYTDEGQVSARYLVCPGCQQNVSYLVDKWLNVYFLPNHPEWIQPTEKQIRMEAEIVFQQTERITNPQMVLL